VAAFRGGRPTPTAPKTGAMTVPPRHPACAALGNGGTDWRTTIPNLRPTYRVTSDAPELQRRSQVAPTRHIQHPHETVPAVNCWSLPPSMLRGVAVKTVRLVNAEKVIIRLTSE
jgi:hypothetical protein